MRLLQSLTRGLEVIDALAESPYPIRLTDISRNLELKNLTQLICLNHWLLRVM